MRKTITNNFYEVELKKLNKTVAHASCSVVNDSIQIRDLFVEERYRNNGIEEYLLAEVNEYAKEKQAKQIITYLGAEPMCKSGQMRLPEEKQFYENNGFIQSHLVGNVIPCMVKTL